MLPGISDFLKDTFTENVKGLLQPSNWLVASIFLILNVFFIIPALVDHNITIATQLIDLNPGLQFALAVAMVLVFAYLLSLMSNGILKSMMPDVSLVNYLLGLKKPTNRGFPSLRKEVNAIAYRLLERYGINMKSLWLYIELAIAEEEVLTTRIRDEKAALDFFVNLNVVFILFAIEHAFVQFFWQQGSVVLWSWVFLLLACLIYYAAVIKVRDWGEVVLMAFNIHREKLRQKIGLRQFKDKDDEKDIWWKVHLWTQYKEVPDDIFSEPLPLSVTSSENVSVTLRYGITDIADPQGMPVSNDSGEEVGIEKVYQAIDYIMLVSNTKTGSNDSAADGAYIVISDPQVPVIYTAPTAKDWDGTATVAKIIPAKESGITHQLLWHIEKLPSNGSDVLIYNLHSQIVRATTNKSGLQIKMSEEKSQDTSDITYTFEITSPKKVDGVTLEVVHTRRTLPDSPPPGFFTKPNSPKGPIPSKRLLKPDGFKWELGTLDENQKVMLQYTI